MPTQERRGSPLPPHWRLEAVLGDRAPTDAVDLGRRPPGGVHPGSRHVRHLAAPARRRARCRPDQRPRSDAVLGGHDADDLPEREPGRVRRRRQGLGGRRGGRSCPRGRRRLGARCGSATTVWSSPSTARRGAGWPSSRSTTRGRSRWSGPHPGSTRTATKAARRSRPTGLTVAYRFRSHTDLTRSEIRVVDVATGEARALTGAAGIEEAEPAWSPDGRTLAFTAQRGEWWELRAIDLAAGDDTLARRRRGRLLRAGVEP